MSFIPFAIFLLIIFGLLVLALGLLQLFSSSFLQWRMNLFSKIAGRKLNPSTKGNTFGGLVLVLLGIFLLYQGFFLLNRLSSIY